MNGTSNDLTDTGKSKMLYYTILANPKKILQISEFYFFQSDYCALASIFQ